MNKQNKATADIVKALDTLGYNVDKVAFTPHGGGENPYLEVEIILSRQGYPPET